MTQTLIALSVWLHSVGTVIFIGHFVLLSAIYLPVFENNQADSTRGMILSEISKRSRGWMYGSLLVFVITGIYLMFADPNYLGIGNFGNLWSILMLLKHILVLGMIGMGFWFNAILRVGPLMSSNSGAGQAFARFRQYSNLMAVTGILILLLTSISQLQ
jgi:uncharacterized membrane protein